jgi:hypothetical protein
MGTESIRLRNQKGPIVVLLRGKVGTSPTVREGSRSLRRKKWSFP